ncbi:winged helix-turn-helix domain-containing protein [Microcoleus sp. CAWBG58]|uniref:winged helix-turn-helix domain-containing protein n=1 Tax=Microcoleus sp. CAWBG58 TaxID=2841651 RepID=UPI0025D2FCEE|nr:winged helix-turn-helix domain-containing protein [Microcoleus sp. CAWBG58]
MIINLSEVPVQYQEQVHRFLVCYPRTGQELAERYLAVVTSPEYAANPGGRTVSKKKNNQQKEPRKDRQRFASSPGLNPKKVSPQEGKRSIILNEISLNPGQHSKQIAAKTGISVHSVRQILVALTREGIVKELIKGTAGYYPSEES